MITTEDIQLAISHLYDHADKAHFAGDDPFDGLNAKLFTYLPQLKDSVFGLAWTQLFKRSPINFRRLAAIPAQRNPKGVALFMMGMLAAHKREPNPLLLQKAQALGDWLLSQVCDSTHWSAPCWGYHFPWKARAFYVPLGTPNLITTVYVSKALYQLGLVSKQEKFINAALKSADFMVEKLYLKNQGAPYFCYIPGESTLVHNANLWAAAWVRFSAEKRNNPAHKAIAMTATHTSLSAQQEDGRWPYGARSHHQFVDGFHTGYNLETLQIINDFENDNAISATIEKGLTYYKSALFEADGTAKYYNTSRYPLDTHNFAQAVLTLLKLGTSEDDFALADKVVNCCFEQLYLPKEKRFVYQKEKHFSNNINYIRWTQSWAYYVLNEYLNRKLGIAE